MYWFNKEQSWSVHEHQMYSVKEGMLGNSYFVILLVDEAVVKIIEEFLWIREESILGPH